MPVNLGVSGQTFQRQKINYFNDFAKPDCPVWYPESDNVKSLKKVHNFVFMPMIGHEGQSNGLIQMFNFKNPITRLQVRKYAALSKYLGSCLEKVTMESMMIETVVGLDLMMSGL